ncbi:hypothetical protein MLD38_015798 [Melastoma candidum]|uniref:Uncharacterized protein n=1 Tax=Melastoma candidum TaxID=119954 RepID=A0ACB9RLI4_9MYRT|nr:hypothetical protein MLD38_015798 [Melastoma candidum]
MLSPILACCKVYISESRNRAALEAIERTAKHLPEVAIVNRFEDEIYNRVGYTVVSRLQQESSNEACTLKTAVLSMVKAAFEKIDLELHSGSHPRLGVVDHVCFHPLARTNLEQVAGIAKSLAVDVGSGLQVPAFLYGAAHDEERTLDSIRRELGYFKPNSTGNLWVGGPGSDPLPLRPDFGPSSWSRGKGVVVIGATRWVDNYNVPIYTRDIAAVRKIARHVSGRGGGLASVQSMALSHGNNVVEVACNLLDPCKVGSEEVQAEVERLAGEAGMSAGKGYYTDLSQEKIIQSFLNSSPSV